MTKIKIELANWRRGGDTQRMLEWGPVCLLNAKGKLCCLGFISEQLGVPRDAIFDKGEPNEIASQWLDKIPQLMEVSDDDYDDGFEPTIYTTLTTREAIDINDDEDSTDMDKIAKLTELFAKVDIELEFV